MNYSSATPLMLIERIVYEPGCMQNRTTIVVTNLHTISLGNSMVIAPGAK